LNEIPILSNWAIINSFEAEDGIGFRIRKNDVIKLGRVKLRILQIYDPLNKS